MPYKTVPYHNIPYYNVSIIIEFGESTVTAHCLVGFFRWFCWWKLRHAFANVCHWHLLLSLSFKFSQSKANWNKKPPDRVVWKERSHPIRSDPIPYHSIPFQPISQSANRSAMHHGKKCKVAQNVSKSSKQNASGGDLTPLQAIIHRLIYKTIHIRYHQHNANAHPGDPTCNRKRLFCRQSNWYFYWLTGIYMTRFPEACEKKCWANWKRECAHRCQWVKVAMQITLPKQKKKKTKKPTKKSCGRSPGSPFLEDGGLFYQYPRQWGKRKVFCFFSVWHGSVSYE